MRGKRAVSGAVSGAYGITPADAGKTILRQQKVYNVEDHPRRCGENRRWTSKAARYGGSPPQMRGKRFVVSCSK